MKSAVLATVATASFVVAVSGAGSSVTPSELIAFHASGAVPLHDIEVVASDGTARRNVTRTVAVDEVEPTWSPDGKRLAFRRAEVAVGVRPPKLAALYVMDASGRGRRKLVARRDMDVWAPAWSPRGRWIAFSADRRGPGEPQIFLVRTSGQGLRRLTRMRAGAYGAAWSPDGRRLAFSATVVRIGADRRRYGQSEIFMVNRDGAGLRRLTVQAKDDSWPAWSPDGTRIAFTSDRDSVLGENPEIYVMNADGSDHTRLTFNAGPDFGPVWSPDGTRIAFTRLLENEQGSNLELLVMNADGSCLTRLTETPLVDESGPAWRPGEGGNGPLSCG